MQVIIRTLTWTLIHSLWQGLLAAVLAAIIISSTRRSTARLRYNLLSVVMILFFAVSVVTFIIQWRLETKPVAAPSFTITGDVSVINSTSWLMDNFIAWVNANSDIVVLAWAFFFLLSCIRLITGLATVNRFRHYKTHPVTTEWKAKLEQLQLVIGIRHSVSLLQSELVKVPVALGILKPVILLPLGLLTHLPAEQVETILLHELAHVRRRDYLVNLLQHVAEAIFFFNPAMRWLSSLIRQEREACCDDVVVASCNQKTNYLNALISFQEYSLRHSSYAMGIGCKRHYLLNRVKRMITNKNNGINFFEKIALLAGVLLFSAFSFVTKEKEMKPATIQQPAAAVSSPVISNISKPELQSIKKGKKKINLFNKPVADTVPVKKDKLSNGKNNNGNKSLPKSNEKKKATADADAAFKEIVQLKNQIGLKKESIGVMKEQLKTKEGPEKEKILNEIKRERGEIDGKRRELDIKRAQWENLKEKAKEKQKEEENRGEKTKTVHENKSVTIENKHDVKQRDMNDVKKWELKKPISGDFDAINFEIDYNKVNKQEFQYEMNLPLKDPPPTAPRAAPEKLKNPEAPAKKVRQ